MIFLFTTLICFLGIYCGVAVGKIAEEELADGKKYFIILENVILSGIIFFIIAFYARNIPVAIIGGICGYLLFHYLKIRTIRKALLIYSILGGVIYFGYWTSIHHPGLLTYPSIATLTFLYGFPSGSLLLQKKMHILKPGVYALPLLLVAITLSIL